MNSFEIENWKSKSELHLLSRIPSAPKHLYAIGKYDPELFTNCVAVVGSRRMTNYGKQVIEQIVPKLVFGGITIVSGFMYGVDQYAHEVCIESGGKTIAVLGWGIDVPLEDADKSLAEKIVSSGGLLLSEWQTQKAALWTFPVRNRIVVGLCDEVIVIEAAIKSGSLITANIASTLKRKLWAVPGPITAKTSQGTNALIASGEAQMWLGKEKHKSSSVSNDPLLRLLENESLTTDEIARKLGKSIASIGAQLSLLTITGAIVERDGKYHVE